MAEIINLRRARKAKARQAGEAQASENRVRFGLPKAERERLDAERDLESRRAGGHRLDRAAKPGDEECGGAS